MPISPTPQEAGARVFHQRVADLTAENLALKAEIERQAAEIERLTNHGAAYNRLVENRAAALSTPPVRDKPACVSKTDDGEIQAALSTPPVREEARPWQSACIDTVLNELPKDVQKRIPAGVRDRLALLVTPGTSSTPPVREETE